MMSGAAEPKANKGGVNPKQIGLGMMTASIDKLMTQGALQTTSKNTDLAISGEGFFILADGDKRFYTRAGNFDVDKKGNFVNPASGMKVQGWNAVTDAKGNRSLPTTGDQEDVFIPLYSKDAAKETSFVRFKSNLNSSVLPVPTNATEAERMAMINDPDKSKRRGHQTSIKVFDDQGKQHTLKVLLWKTDQNKWSGSVSLSDASKITVDVLGPQGTNTSVPGNTQFQLGFSPDGKLTSVSDGTDVKNTGKLSANLTFRIPGNPAVRTIKLNLGEAGKVAGITQFASGFTTKIVEQDGNTMGYMESFTIDPSGIITGFYSNGTQKPLAQVAMANFANPEGLVKAGGTNFVESNNSGTASVGQAGEAGLGNLNAGFLEMSNVDLADQFTDMIVTQRGFQANSRSITTSDQMIQEKQTSSSSSENSL